MQRVYLWGGSAAFFALRCLALLAVHDEQRTRALETRAGWERLGARAAAWREANERGWDSLLPHFTAACAAA